MIASQVPDAKIDGFVGRRTSFEVKASSSLEHNVIAMLELTRRDSCFQVNDVEIHSKIKTAAFPDFEEVTQIVQDTSAGSNPTAVTKTQSSCVIV